MIDLIIFCESGRYGICAGLLWGGHREGLVIEGTHVDPVSFSFMHTDNMKRGLYLEVVKLLFVHCFLMDYQANYP